MTFTFKPIDAGKLDATRHVGNVEITLRAENVRQPITGTHCKVALFAASTLIWSDTINVDDGKDRHGYANQLYGTKQTAGKLPHEIAAQFPSADFEHEFMVWSRTLWNAWIGATAGADIAGDAQPSAPPWAVPGLVLNGSTGIWAGDAGANKSTLARFVAQSIRHGVDWLIPARKQAPVIWVNAEEPPEEHTRQLGNVNAALGLERHARMFTIEARGMSITDLTVRLAKAVREQKAEHIFIDSLSRLAQGSNLNDNNTATMLVDAVAGLGPSVTWIGHTGHENRQRLAGSRHFENAARLMVLVQSRIGMGGVSPELTRGVRARVYKANATVPTEPQYWRLNYDRQHGVIAADWSAAEQWPVLHCGAFVGEGTCRRKTWDGVTWAGEVRCSRHRDEEEGGA